VNEQIHPESPDPATSGEVGSQPEPSAPRPRRRPGFGQVGAAATSRTAGWMVAAALGGSLVTLLLVPDRLPAAAPAGIAFQRPAFVRPGGGRPPGTARRFAIPAQPPGQVYAGPGGRKVLGPATVMPGCQFAVPGGLRPGGPARFRLVHPPMAQRIVVLPGKRGPRIEIVRPPAMRRIAIWSAGRPGARRFGRWTITRRGRGGIVQWTSPRGGIVQWTSPRGRTVPWSSPGRGIVQWTAPGGAIVVGPGNIVAAPPAGPGCVIYSRVGPASAPAFGR
jgi:hypothetical protein